jgi:amidase
VTLRTPDLDELIRISEVHHLGLTVAELRALRTFVDAALESARWLDSAEPTASPKTVGLGRDGYVPDRTEDPLNAWAWRCSIRTHADGPLAGLSVGIKDNVSVAGAPLLHGSALMTGFVPDTDATIVTRILDAGAEIVGKTTCDDTSFSGGGHTAIQGPVLNPYDRTRLAGGSSAGSAVAVAAGHCDVAIGGDQGGSVRIPSSWSGATGFKPTFGLVPYTGIISLEPSIDHVGPLARSVRDIIRVMAVIAGPDRLDPRQAGVEAMAIPPRGPGDTLSKLRIGILRDGFGWPDRSETDVDAAVRAAAANFGSLGAELRDVSVPAHRTAFHLWNCVNVEGGFAQLFLHDGSSRGVEGDYPVAFLRHYSHARRSRGGRFPLTVKLTALIGQYLTDAGHGDYYARAQNMRRTLRSAYDEILEEVDVLLMPTTPMKAVPDDPRGDLETYFGAASRNSMNTSPFDLTGHPALSVPCALSDGLPVGLMIVGRRREDALVLEAGRAFQEGYAPSFMEPVAHNPNPS